MYYPDKWLLVKIETPDTNIFKVFGVWHGNVVEGDSWRMNSGITNIEEDEKTYTFSGYSKSKYFCSKETYGSNKYGFGVLESLKERVSKIGKGYKLHVLEDDFDIKEILSQNH